MKILLLADEPNLRLWDYLDRTLLEGIDLIVLYIDCLFYIIVYKYIVLDSYHTICLVLLEYINGIRTHE